MAGATSSGFEVTLEAVIDDPFLVEEVANEPVPDVAAGVVREAGPMICRGLTAAATAATVESVEPAAAAWEDRAKQLVEDISDGDHCYRPRCD